MKCGKMAKGGSVKSGGKQVPAQFEKPKVAAGFKKGGSVSCYKKGGTVKHDDAAQDKKLIGKMIAAADKKESSGVKKGGTAVKKSYSDNGAPVKKIPMKLAAGGAAKTRKNFPMTKPIPKKK